MKKIYYILIFTLIAVIVARYTYIAYGKYDYYYEKYLNATNKIVYGLNAPRGRILDRNGKVLVDNKGINTIVYHNLDNIDTLSVARTLLTILDDVREADVDSQKNFYLKYNETDNLLTKEEKELYARRKLSTTEVEEIKKER